ncbi:MAG: DNA-3-methyladenine glycosylase 2 family protein [Armatimonadetes bacterium]|nr:DNA-3-methyladenine glycosylase 2 family protein [Armatimonadota bacterium]
MLHQSEELAKAIAHIQKCDVLGPVTLSSRAPEYAITDDPYLYLTRAIVYQQLSGKAAGTIWGRLEESLPGKKVTPESILRKSVEELRAVGLSYGKANYVQCIADAVLGGLPIHDLKDMSDVEVRKTLLPIKGIGNWSVDMFLMFGLCRPDVWPTGDQGIKNGLVTLFGLAARPKEDEMTELAERWEPYRTVASHYIWRSLEIETPD